MFDEINIPENDRKWIWIFEKADDKLYKREFGAEPSTRVLISEHKQ